MGGIARANHAVLERFTRRWENLLEAFPAARAAAVAEMGKTVKRDLDAQIIEQGVDDMFGHIRNAQTIRLGSYGGYAAVSATAHPMTDRYGKTKTWKGRQIYTRQVTKWLEKGHMARQPSGKGKQYRPRLWRHAGDDDDSGVIIGNHGKPVVKAHLFYSWTRLKALDHALEAAEKVLNEIAEKSGLLGGN